MPSQPIDTGWGFDAVLGLIGSDFHIASPTLSVASQATIHPKDNARQRSPRLGDFSKLFGELGIPEQIMPASPVDSEDLTSSDDAIASMEQNKLHVPSGESTSDDVLDKRLGSTGTGDGTGPTSPLLELTSRQQKQVRKKAAQRARKARKAVEALDTHVVPTPDVQQATQSRAQSNVGVKIQPATPSFELSLDAPALNLAQAPQSTANPTHSSTPIQRLNSLAEPFTPARHNARSPYLFAAHDAGMLSEAAPIHLVNEGTSRGPRLAAPLVPSNVLIPRTVLSVTNPKVHDTKTIRPNHYHGTSPLQVVSPAAQPLQQSVATYRTGPFEAPVTEDPGTLARGLKQLIIRPKTDRHFHFMNQLLARFPLDVKWLVAPMQLFNEKTIATQGIHCFVDASNIMIGFKDILRRSGHAQLELSFDSLALLMERRRPVAKRIYASSHREAAPLPHVTRLAETSKAVGYENLVKEQVFIRREDSERKKFFKDVEKMGWNKATQRRTGNSSGSDSETGQAPPPSTPPPAPKWVEQGVDEILHLKMCQSIIDTDVPTTMVLATGDGNAAEFSDGFLANVERALKKGWTVELLSWKQQMSGGYKNKKFRAKWGEQFKILELDDYLESLVETP